MQRDSGKLVISASILLMRDLFLQTRYPCSPNGHYRSTRPPLCATS